LLARFQGINEFILQGDGIVRDYYLSVDLQVPYPSLMVEEEKFNK